MNRRGFFGALAAIAGACAFGAKGKAESAAGKIEWLTGENKGTASRVWTIGRGPQYDFQTIQEWAASSVTGVAELQTFSYEP